MKLINLTPHKVVVMNDDRNILHVINPSGIVARVKMDRVLDGNIDGIPIFKVKFTDVVDVPAPQKDTFFIVSNIVAQALKGKRNDLIVPDTALAIRDADGRIIGVKGFIRI